MMGTENDNIMDCLKKLECETYLDNVDHKHDFEE